LWKSLFREIVFSRSSFRGNRLFAEIVFSRKSSFRGNCLQFKLLQIMSNFFAN
jgi:hypothetical protein